MVFDPNKFEIASVSLQNPEVNAPKIYTYVSSTDTLATIVASGYFNYFAKYNRGLRYSLAVGDLIWCAGTDAGSFARVTAVTTNVTVSQDVVPAGSIVNADISAAAAIDFSKLAALNSGRILVGSAGNVATSVAMSGDATMSNAGALSLIAGIPRTISVDVTAAEFNGAYAAPKQILAAPSAGTHYVVHGVQFEFDYGGAQFTNGGVMGIQYDNTANGAGILTHTGVAAAVVNGVNADFVIGAAGFNLEGTTGGAASSIVAKGLFLSNKTAAFATGTSDIRVHLTYSTVTTSL